jgi:plastocyanin
MTVRARNRALTAASIIAVVALAATLLPMVASSRADSTRDLRIVVRDMAFYVDGGAEPNPSITLRAGVQVRLHLRNEDAGMRHDFVVKPWAVSTKMLEDRGEEDTIVFRAPTERGEATYLCTPHAKMMSGTIRIE